MEVFEKTEDYFMRKIESGQLTNVAHNIWINSLKPVKLEGTTAYFTVQSDFQAGVIMQNYVHMIKEALAEVLGFEVDVKIDAEETVSDEEDNDPNQRKAELEESFSNAEYDYTFDTFIVGRSNEFAYAACTAVARDPGSTYNPLFIHGPSGLGKTHLMTAISNEIKKNRPDTNILCKRTYHSHTAEKRYQPIPPEIPQC